MSSTQVSRINFVPDYPALFRNAVMQRNATLLQSLLEDLPEPLLHLVKIFPSVPPFALIETMAMNDQLIQDLVYYQNHLPLTNVSGMSSEAILYYLQRLEQVLGAIPVPMLVKIWKSWQSSSIDISSDADLDLLQFFVDASRRYITPPNTNNYLAIGQ